MLTKIKSNFPTNKHRWMLFAKTSLPIIFAAMIFSLNSFVDNFMAITIESGIDKLSYANTWTTLVMGIIMATTIIGSSLFGQYYGAKDRLNTRYVVRSRVLISLFISMLFALPAFINPEFMINLVGSFQVNELIVADSAMYLRIIAVTWITGAWGYTSAMIMREAGNGKASLVSSIISLTSNTALNAVFIFGLNLGIWSLAISSIISQIFSVGFNIIYVWIKNKEIIVNPLKLFSISKLIWKQIFRRSISFLFLAFGSVTISIRFIFWNINYSPGTIGSNPLFYISAATILGISGAFFNIFWSTFESVGANTTVFVGRELGNGNLEQAKTNARELQGFHFVMAIIMGSILLSFSFVIPSMSFLAEGYKKGTISQLVNSGYSIQDAEIIASNGVKEYLTNLKMTLWPLAGFMPIWIWYLTRSRCISAGGKTNITSMVDAIGGLVQTCWISILVFVIVPYANLPFPTAYALFFLSDTMKVITYETLFHKLNWAKNLTLEIKDPDTISWEIQNKKN